MTFDPFSQVAKGFSVWQKLASELETKGVERATGAIEETARLTKETFAYGAQMAAEWRKLSLEILEQTTTTLATPKA